MHPILDMSFLPGEDAFGDLEQEPRIVYSYFKADLFVETTGLD